MKIEFLAHAGFCIKTKNLEVLIDPWLTPSTLENPVLESFMPGHKTIDYLIPEPLKKREDYNPDMILFSHYHTHHSPKVDVDYWLSTAKKRITIIGFDIHPDVKDKILSEFKEKYPKHTFLTTFRDCEFEFDGLKIRCLTYTQQFHLSYFLDDGHSSFLHLADAQINRIFYDRRLDPLWFKFGSLHPSLVTTSVGSVSCRSWDKANSDSPVISENSFLSPVEAANLINFLNPKMAAVMGVFNFSIWKNRTEFGFSALENEAYFRWALQHLNNKIQIPVLRPGTTFNFKEDGTCSISLTAD